MAAAVAAVPAIVGVENKDDILSCAQLEARQQLLSEQPEKCTEIGSSSVVCSSDQLSIVEQCPAATPLPSVATSARVLEEVKAEETLPIPVGSSIVVPVPCVASENSAEQAQRNEPSPVVAAGGVGKVLLYVKNDTPTIEQPAGALPAQQRNRILRELNSIPAVSKAPSLPSSATSRPVSVTASIFTSLPTGTSGSGAEKPRKQQPAAAATSPQSVTAKLFVTLPPASGGASAAAAAAAGCNGGGGASGAGSKPQHATEKIFAPRTEDMNKGFLMFSEEEPGLTSKYTPL
uniref:Uncharacterized protein n=1 Tax=Anopheles dirus TaxID=7168 RepID=A0A182NG12_9DIPT